LPLQVAHGWLRTTSRVHEATMSTLRVLARFTAYTIALLLALVWISGGIASLERPLYDLGRAHIGDSIIALARSLSLSPAGILRFACMLAGLKLLLGAYFLLAIVMAAYERIRWRISGDEMLEVGLFMSALASIVAVSPLLHDRLALGAAIGELLLCVLASGLVAFARTPVRKIASRREEPALESAVYAPVSARISDASLNA
jgi:hypothetical protein